MKTFIMFLMAIFMASFTAEAQKLTSVKPYGSKGLYTVTPTNDTITIVPKYSASGYVIPIDTTVYLAIDATSSLPLNLVYLQLKADSTERFVHFITGFQAAATDSIAATKTKVYTFITTNTGKFTLLGKSAEY